MPEEKEEVVLRVGELTDRQEFGRGLVRIDTKTMARLNIREGDVVELVSQRKTGAIAVRAYPVDVGLNIIRMDGIVRRNAGVGIGETIKLSRAEAKEAQRVVVAPVQKGILLQMSPELLRRNLFMRPVAKKDIIIPFPVVKQRRGSPFDDFMGINLEEIFFTPIPGETKLIVVSTLPEGIVRVTDATEIELKPQAVEIEEKEIPTMSYEDIGGLGDAIQKIREMVELPLRHPELFTKLGIDPPKGVLLYGPPGTGKTLLAKAVANESNASFTVINGPEVISKWYGQSLPGDETVLVFENGIARHVPIKELVEQGKDAQVVAFAKDGKVKFTKIKDFFKHPLHGRLLEVRTRTGRRIRVTDYHSLFALTDSGVADVKTSDLVPKKSYIAIPRSIPTPEAGKTELDLLKILPGLRVKNAGAAIKQAAGKLGIAKTAEILGVRRKYVYDLSGKAVGVPVEKFLLLMHKADITCDPRTLRISSKFGKGSLPAQLRLTPGLLRLFGLWLAEGDINQGRLRISSPAQEHKDDVAATCKELGIPVSLYPTSIVIGSESLAKLLLALGFTRYSTKKRIPGFISALPKPLIAQFLRGYASGDGSVYANQRGNITIELTTYSNGLANDLLYLLLQFGIVASVYSNPVGRSTRNRVCFRGADHARKFLSIGFMDDQRQRRLTAYLKRLRWERSDQLPLVSPLRPLAPPEWQGSRTIGRGKLLHALRRADPQRTKHPEAWKIAESDLYWDRVEEIREVPPEPFVYDLSINPTENFLAGFGGIFAHNSEENLRKIFENAEKAAPAIIFIDEIDAIAPKREEVTGEVERRVVSQILTLMDGLKSRGKVIVIAATNRPNALDPALRRPGRFDREVEIGVPDEKGRLEILQIHTRNMPLTDDVDLRRLAKTTYGFVGADLEALAKEAAMAALRRNLPAISWKKLKELPKDVMDKLRVTKDDFQSALKLVEPSAMREVLIEVPNVQWGDIGGLEDAKQRLKEIVEWPLKNADAFKRMGIRPPSGVLLYGPPGTGKTLLAKAVATESGANFISIRGPELLSKWVGESERHVRDVFRRAKQVAPAIIFFDEVDALAPRRGQELGTHVTENVVSQILTEMSGIEELTNVVVIAATNRPDIIDPALLRPGRFDRQILVPAPEEAARLEIFRLFTRNMPLDKAVSLPALAKATEGYTGADIEAIAREAGLNALRADMKAKTVTKRHFDDALKASAPSVSAETIKFYQQMLAAMKQPVEKKELGYVG